MKKKLIILISIVCLIALFASVTGTSYAKSAELTSTQNFLKFLDEKGIIYTNIGVDGDIERVEVSFEMENFDSLTCVLFFKDDCEEASLRIWNIVQASAEEDMIFSTLNSLNKDYKFAKFVFDDSDSTVQAEFDMYIDGEHCGRSLYDAMMILFQIIDDNDVAEQLHALE